MNKVLEYILIVSLVSLPLIAGIYFLITSDNFIAFGITLFCSGLMYYLTWESYRLFPRNNNLEQKQR